MVFTSVLFVSFTLYFTVSCDYSEYSEEGLYLGENTDPTAGFFSEEAEAEAYRLDLLSDPEVLCAWVSASEGSCPFKAGEQSEGLYW